MLEPTGACAVAAWEGPRVVGEAPHLLFEKSSTMESLDNQRGIVFASYMGSWERGVSEEAVASRVGRSVRVPSCFGSSIVG